MADLKLINFAYISNDGQIEIQFPEAQITDFRQNRQTELNTFLTFSLRDFLVPNLNLLWLDEPVFKASIVSQNNEYSAYGAHIRGQGQIVGELSISEEILTKNLAQTNKDPKSIRKIMRETELKDINGRIDARLAYEEENVDFSLQADVVKLGNLGLIGHLTSYDPKKIAADQAKIDDVRFHNILIDYRDDQLLDGIVDGLGVDPALLTFLAQITLPNFFSRDRELNLQLANELGNLAQNKKGFSMAVEAREPKSIEEILEIWDAHGPIVDNFNVAIKVD